MERPPVEQNSKSPESRETLLSIVQNIEEITESPDLSPLEIQERCRPLVKEFLEHMKSDLNLTLSPEVSIFYGEMQRQNLLARVESVQKVIECISAGIPISVGKHESHYANAVTAELEGLRIAMSEADVIGPVRLLVGLDLKALIGFKSDHIEVTEIDDSEFDFRDTGLRKSMCRHITGEILPEDIRYVIMRIPRGYFPEEDLLPNEEGQSIPFIFRGASVKASRVGREEKLAEAA